MSIFYSKEEYLESKTTKYICPNHCKKPLTCGSCFWNAIQLPPTNIPMCKVCIADTKMYEELLLNKKEKGFKANCCKHCLWWDWFDHKRMVTKNSSISSSNE